SIEFFGSGFLRLDGFSWVLRQILVGPEFALGRIKLRFEQSDRDKNLVHIVPSRFCHPQVATKGRAAAAHYGFKNRWTDFRKLFDQEIIGLGGVLDDSIVAARNRAEQVARR